MTILLDGIPWITLNFKSALSLKLSPKTLEAPSPYFHRAEGRRLCSTSCLNWMDVYCRLPLEMSRSNLLFKPEKSSKQIGGVSNGREVQEAMEWRCDHCIRTDQ
jgi:hypothetical protein